MNAALVSDTNPDGEPDGKEHVNGTVKLDKQHGKLSIFFSDELQQRERLLGEDNGEQSHFYRSIQLPLKDIDVESVDARGNAVTDIRKSQFFTCTKGDRATIECADLKTGSKVMTSHFYFQANYLSNPDGFLDAFTRLVKAYSRSSTK
jgi:hypothetical protein